MQGKEGMMHALSMKRKEHAMPALQVRDFPDDLYERLKEYAADQHRSVAQQTIVAVEQMLARADEPGYHWDGERLRCPRPRYFDFDTEAARAERAKRRKELFAEIRKLPKFDVPDGFPDAAEMIRQDREERVNHILGTVGIGVACEKGAAK